MKQKSIISSRILSFVSALVLVISSPSWSDRQIWGQPSVSESTVTTDSENSNDQAVDQNDQKRSAGEDVRVNEVTLKKALTRFALSATQGMKPDIRNGLIRVAVMTARGENLDLATRQALSTELALIVAEQPNVMILEPSTEREVMSRFDRLGLELSDNRSISLGQHLGVRYVVNLFVEPAEGTSIRIKTKTISIKQRGFLKGSDNEALISKSEISQFQQKAIFYESRLDATLRSALLPGLGQLYQGRTGAAVAYMSLTAGLLIGGIVATQAGNEAATLYRENTSDKVYYRQLANSHYARARLLWGGLSITWLSSAVSAYLQGQDKAHVKFGFDPQQGSFNLSGVY